MTSCIICLENKLVFRPCVCVATYCTDCFIIIARGNSLVQCSNCRLILNLNNHLYQRITMVQMIKRYFSSVNLLLVQLKNTSFSSKTILHLNNQIKELLIGIDNILGFYLRSNPNQVESEVLLYQFEKLKSRHSNAIKESILVHSMIVFIYLGLLASNVVLIFNSTEAIFLVYCVLQTFTVGRLILMKYYKLLMSKCGIGWIFLEIPSVLTMYIISGIMLDNRFEILSYVSGFVSVYYTGMLFMLNN